MKDFEICDRVRVREGVYLPYSRYGKIHGSEGTIIELCPHLESAWVLIDSAHVGPERYLISYENLTVLED